MYTCSDCGKESKRGGQCWDKYGMCAKCSKKNYKKALKCKRCDNTSNHVTGKCWKLYGICGECYKKEFCPAIIIRYTLCKKCGDYLVRATTNKNGQNVHLPYRICTTCHIIYVENHNWNVQPLE